MLRLFNFLLYGCSSCSWEVINTEHISYKSEFEQGQATRYTLQCVECGNIKTRLAK